MLHKYKRSFIAFSFVPLVLFLKLLDHFPEYVERIYSNGIYIWISKLLRYAFGWLPFSMGDVLYTLLAIYVIRWFYVNRKRIIKDTKNWLLDILSALSLGYIAFHFFWAFNYYRIPLHQSLKLEKDYTTEQLVNVTDYLIERANAAHLKLVTHDTIKVNLPYSKTEIINKVPQGYEALQNEFPDLSYSPASIKNSIYSLPLTYMGFSGYLNPFTNEAQVDGLIPKFKYPTTAGHEAAHQLGYAAENEANFIGCLATISNDDPYFKYSGYAFALKHCLNELYLRESSLYENALTKINKGILKNYHETRMFWKSYQNPIEPILESTYDSYLKAHKQDQGLKTYSYVVALFVNYFQAH